MCYHNSLHAQPEELIQKYELNPESCPAFRPISHSAGFDLPEWPILLSAFPEKYTIGQWGLVPSWALTHSSKAGQIQIATLNARAETLAEKPAFKEAFRQSQRCIIPSTGFFEWQTRGAKKYPYFIHMKNKSIFSMAGIWESNEEATSGAVEYTFSIITVPANPLMATIHNTKMRMPALLSDEHTKPWLDTTLPESQVMELLRPFPEEELLAYPIQPFLGSKSNDRFDVITKPLNDTPRNPQLGLF